MNTISPTDDMIYIGKFVFIEHVYANMYIYDHIYITSIR